MDAAEFATALNLGKVAQIGCVVRNLERSVANYERILGVGPFVTFGFRPEKGFVRGRSPEIDLKIGVAQLTTELSLELIEVVAGDPYHKDFLEAHGEGVQHLGYLSDDYDGALARAHRMGVEVLMWAETDVAAMGHVRGAYLDTLELLGTLVEVIEVKPF